MGIFDWFSLCVWIGNGFTVEEHRGRTRTAGVKVAVRRRGPVRAVEGDACIVLKEASSPEYGVIAAERSKASGKS